MPSIAGAAKVEIQAEIRFLPAAAEFARAFFEAFPDISGNRDCLYQLQLAVSEALTNIMKYAYQPETPGRVTLSLTVHSGRVVIVLADTGVPFDPAGVPEPDLDNPKGRGLGMFFLREMMDSVLYSRDGQTNLLTLTKDLAPCGGDFPGGSPAAEGDA